MRASRGDWWPWAYKNSIYIYISLEERFGLINCNPSVIGLPRLLRRGPLGVRNLAVHFSSGNFNRDTINFRNDAFVFQGADVRFSGAGIQAVKLAVTTRLHVPFVCMLCVMNIEFLLILVR